MVKAKLRRDAMAILRAALAAVEAGNAVRAAWRTVASTINPENYDRVFLVAAGKAAVEMAAAVQKLSAHA